MLASMILILIVFISIVVLILKDKYNRGVLALTGAAICYIVLTFLEKLPLSSIIDFLVGSPEEDFINLQSLILIFGMTIVVNISYEAGVFRYISFKLVQFVAKKPKRLLPTFCLISFFLSAILNNILAVIILIPLTITMSRMLNFDPEPYILTQAIVVNIGGTLFSISSIPNILIALEAGITFNQFFVNVGIFSLVVFFVIVGLFYLQYKRDLHIDEKNLTILMDFNPMNFIQSKALFRKSTITLVVVLLGFILIPSSILPGFMISFLGAIILLLICKLDQDKIIKSIDLELFLYLMGIFVIAGAIEAVGVITILGRIVLNASGGNPLGAILIVLWFSAILSATIDNIPITKVLIPVVSFVVLDFSPEMANLVFYSLSIGANWGDNLTPMGDNILVMNLAEKNKRPINSKKFFKLGFVTTLIQLYIATLFFAFFFNVIVGIILLICFLVYLGVRFYIHSEDYFGKKWDIKPLIQQIKDKSSEKRKANLQRRSERTQKKQEKKQAKRANKEKTLPQKPKKKTKSKKNNQKQVETQPTKQEHKENDNSKHD